MNCIVSARGREAITNMRNSTRTATISKEFLIEVISMQPQDWTHGEQANPLNRNL
jgi:hypothetical protein